MKAATYAKVQKLNSIYEPLYAPAKGWHSYFAAKGMQSMLRWHCEQFEEYNGEFVKENFPIPIIDVEGFGDIAFNLSETSFDRYFDKEALLALDLGLIFKRFKNRFALYGKSDCTKDIYLPGMNLKDIKAVIENSAEEQIALNILLKDVGADIAFLLEVLPH